MSDALQKYMGCTVEIIYMDRCGKFSKRLVRLRSLRCDHVAAYCYERKAPRLFKISCILAIMPKEQLAL
ncbi:WYL domain-containing protein [Paenibacillus piri]|uniref:WYL domain-containing protein n=1 Tax=Paenibacillus piri TaxID=2547395 RepID=A0A4V2ZUB6_9BACL|nr:WYL domain-containing protein [Paenibacillus piri]TDG00165.1 WYL domain-containing protein [Paenibacillus piri]